jgi:hypothetical protein
MMTYDGEWTTVFYYAKINILMAIKFRIIEKALFGLLLRKKKMVWLHLLSRTDADRIGRNNFIKSAVTIDIGKDRLLLNYDLTQNNNDSYT